MGLLSQLEYYLSDENLRKDSLFNTSIRTHPQHYLDVFLLLGCPRLRKHNVTLQQVTQAVASSTLLEMSPCSLMIRRTSHTPLPPLDPKYDIKKKKVKYDPSMMEQVKQNKHTIECLTQIYYIQEYNKQQKQEERDDKEVEQKQEGNDEEREQKQEGNDEEREQKKEGEDKEREQKKEGDMNRVSGDVLLWNEVKEGINQQLMINMVYITFDKQSRSGFIVVDREERDRVKDRIDIGEVEIRIGEASDIQIGEFYDKHGYHFNGIMQAFLQDKQMLMLKIPFMGQEYNNKDHIKQIFRNIINSTENDQPIEGIARQQIETIVKYHHDYPARFKDILGYTVDMHQIYNDTRCLHVVDEQGKQSFSYVKCVDKYAQEYYGG